jgi:hypothetical protein
MEHVFRVYARKKLVGGLVFGFGILLIFGVFFLAKAVAPGTVTNPVFGPNDDNVSISGGWDPATCYWGPSQCGPMTCGSGEVMVGMESQLNENCGGGGNDRDYSSHVLYCCKLSF